MDGRRLRESATAWSSESGAGPVEVVAPRAVRGLIELALGGLPPAEVPDRIRIGQPEGDRVEIWVSMAGVAAEHAVACDRLEHEVIGAVTALCRNVAMEQ